MSDYTTSVTGPFDITASAELHQASAHSVLTTSPSANPEAQPGTVGVYAVGGYLVGDAEDMLLNGHPDIRY